MPLRCKFLTRATGCGRYMDDIEKLGRYNILRVLGKGAMGVVYEGLDPNLDRAVALKTIRMQGLTPEALDALLADES